MPALVSDRIKRLALSVAFAITTTLALSAQAADDLGNLQVFKGGAGSTQSGKWRMELISSTDPTAQEAMGKMGKMSICVDIAKQMTKNSGTQESDCTTKVIRNTAAAAEVEASCKNGSQSHVTMTREGKDSYLLDATMTSGKDSKPRSFKARYTYEGACQGESLIQMDKSSEACQKMQKETKGMDMSALCAKTPEQYRAQCEQQMKQMQAMCQ